LSNIIRMIESRRMRWAVYVAQMEMRNAYTFLVGKLDEVIECYQYD
jgi:hypothetical protein